MSCVSFTILCLEAQAQQVSARYSGYAGKIFNISLRLNRPGMLQVRTTSPDGDADVFVYNSLGRLIGSGRRRGNDFIGGNAPTGNYIIRLRMTRCSVPTAPCNANLTATLDGRLISLKQEASNLPDSKGTATTRACIEYATRQGYNKATAEVLCNNIR